MYRICKIGLLLPEDTDEFKSRVDKSNQELLSLVRAREHFPLRIANRTKHVMLAKDGENESRFQFLKRAFGDTKIPTNWIDEKLVEFNSSNDFIFIWYIRRSEWRGYLVEALVGKYISLNYSRHKIIVVSNNDLYNQLIHY